MTDTTVAYHADGFAAARPAINVKCHGAGGAFWPAGAPWDLTADETRHLSDLIGQAQERIASDFWQAATEIATQRGLGEITQEGRSGGWLVFTDGRDPQNSESCCEDLEHEDGIECPDATECVRDWLTGYRSIVEWADAFIADAPRKVRDLAQQMAMDEAGEPAALRMFAFGRTA